MMYPMTVFFSTQSSPLEFIADHPANPKVQSGKMCTFLIQQDKQKLRAFVPASAAGAIY
jgi:hypothetical protein